MISIMASRPFKMEWTNPLEFNHFTIEFTLISIFESYRNCDDIFCFCQVQRQAERILTKRHLKKILKGKLHWKMNHLMTSRHLKMLRKIETQIKKKRMWWKPDDFSSSLTQFHLFNWMLIPYTCHTKYCFIHTRWHKKI